VLSEEIRRKSSQETSTLEAMVARGQSKERGKNQRGTSRSKSKGKKVKQKCWYFDKLRHLKKDCWKRQQSSKDDSTKESMEANSTETSLGTNITCVNSITIPSNILFLMMPTPIVLQGIPFPKNTTPSSTYW
jgi:hypothetical protein